MNILITKQPNGGKGKTMKKIDYDSTENMEKKKDIIIKNISEELHYQFALMCKRLRTTMKQRLVDLITKDLNDNKETIK